MTAPAVGIDLGTTYCCVAVYRNGQVDIIPNEQGNRITPSYVAFTDTERLIGDAAKDQDAMNPTNTVFDVKRLIGRRFNDPKLQVDMKIWPFKVIDDVGSPKVKVQYKGVRKTFFPEELSAMVLSKMKGIAEDYFGKPVKNAVITVPAYFNNAQRKATRDAGTIAGLNVLRILNEPTAGALVYGLKLKSDGERNILIYDLGGGTFDVNIISIEEGIHEVRAINGNTHLGGEDFNNLMVLHFLDEYKAKHGIDLIYNQKAICRLRNACEFAKIILSSTKTANINLECLYGNIDFHSSITRARFEELIRNLVTSTIDYVAQALKDANMEKTEINDIVLVGGSTRIPMVRELLSDFFDGKPLNKSVNPDEVVAHGAAIKASMMEGANCEELKDLRLIDAIPLSLGVGVKDDMMSTIIKRNTSIPVKVTREYTTTRDNQTSITANVYEGERLMIKDNNFLDNLTIRDIPLAPCGVSKVNVTFEIDVDGILEVSIVDKLKPKNCNKIAINNHWGRLSRHDIDRMILEAEKYREEDIINKERGEAKNELENYCISIKSKVKRGKVKETMKSSDYIKVLTKCTEAIEWIASNPRAEKLEYVRKLEELKSVCDPVV